MEREPRFDGQSAGTPESQWQEAGLADRGTPLALDRFSRLVVVSAHPDDETLGAAGLIARMSTRGATVTLVVASDGEASHPDSPTHPPARIGRRRRDEMLAAIGHLAPATDVRLLGLPDGRLSAHHCELREAVREVLGAKPGGTLVATPWRDDGHPDHEAVARVVEDAAAETGAAVLEFPVWAWLWATPDDPRLDPARLSVLRLDEREIADKQLAIAEHRSQVEPLGAATGDRPVLRAEFLDHFRRPYEIFLPVRESLSGGHFDRLYAGSRDPWLLADRWYEKRKRALTVAALTRPRFRCAFEPGCGNGLLSRQLAARCDWLLATDCADAAVEIARQRVAGLANVEVQTRAVPREWPDRREFDLVVLSEVGYYCSRTDLSRLIARTVGSLTPDGVVVACHWRHPAPDHPLTGDQVHAALAAESGLEAAVSHLEADFRLDVLTLPGAPSVARWEGVLA